MFLTFSNLLSMCLDIVHEVVEVPEGMPVGTPYFPITDTCLPLRNNQVSLANLSIVHLGSRLLQPFLFNLAAD